MKNISLFQLLGSFFIKFLFCPFISAHYNTLFGKSNQSYCDKNIFICVFYIKQYFYYVFIFFQLFFILFSDFCNADSSYVSYNVFLRWHVIVAQIAIIYYSKKFGNIIYSLCRKWRDSFNILNHQIAKRTAGNDLLSVLTVSFSGSPFSFCCYYFLQ